ncbi:hypothetical protein PHYSODRAFT_326590 [Phytophthora sojae]|uniref:Uncharacterized protein n=1 Tax=Phytophthora sojae (strain P6497) TaxID=1094619 RepID=G4YWF3_PHYSP|nr:hypothetical protein PHYSODRAFT_326590 [Phytophthora sojae]EGZ25599.1 hypothetical protein PHYSODRAFT_326590 [Phytophthora sojae]|eukprot:XP_009520887.1 hypothetical protein PHYSODRAFT_326590 [Phytophthora sojae]
MPTSSRKRKILSTVRKLWKSVLGEQKDDDSGGSSAQEEQEDLAAVYFVLKAKRYLTSRHRVPRPPSRVKFYLSDMPESEFKLQFRLSRRYFTAVCELIADNAEFRSTPGKQTRMSVELHLMGLLRTLGSTDGEGHSADFLSVGGHTPEHLLAKRVVRALNSLRSKVIMWPEADERRDF